MAGEMIQRNHETEAQRLEILQAFVAKYGHQPDNSAQVKRGDLWMLIHFTDEEIARAKKVLLVAKIGKQPLTRWQKFCVWMATK